MRILHVLNHVLKIGNGIVNVAVDLACYQAQEGHCVAVASAGGEYEELLAQYGVQHFKLDQSRTPTKLLSAVRGYRSIVREFQPHIVHGHMMTGLVLARFLGNSKYKLVSTVHNEFQRSAILMGWADCVIAVSGAVASSMLRRGVAPEKLRTVCNGTLDSPRTRPISEYQPLALNRPAITTVAGMYHRKGIAELIDAFSQIAADVPDAHLYLVGDGPDRITFEAQVQSHPLSDLISPRIHFERFQPDPQRYLLSSDIFVLASRQEPFGLAIAEAREAGCAIVASQVDGIPDALDNGTAGVLVPPQNSTALAAALRQLLNDEATRTFWQQRAQQNLEWLSVKRVHQETLAIYQDLVANNT